MTSNAAPVFCLITFSALPSDVVMVFFKSLILVVTVSLTFSVTACCEAAAFAAAVACCAAACAAAFALAAAWAAFRAACWAAFAAAPIAAVETPIRASMPPIFPLPDQPHLSGPV